jgi:glycosyltransferase involved in cell wall biosynthesis
MSLEGPKRLKCLQITTIDLTAYCFLRSWFRFLGDNGFDVTLATTVEQFRGELEETGARVIHVPIARSACPARDFISLVRLYRLIKKEKFDLVHTCTTKAGFIGRLAARLAGVPVIFHSMLEPPHNSARNPLLKTLYVWMERLAALWADHLFTTTTPNLKEILDRKIAPREKVTMIPEGLVMERYENVAVDVEEKRREMGVPPGGIFILTVGRLETVKGYEYLIEAAPGILREFPQAHFVCVGKGKLKESLERKARSLKVGERVRFVGFRDDLPQLYRSCDVFLLPSLWEGQGVASMEAMALKKPVIASGVGGVLDVIEDGISGILILPKDPAAIERAVTGLLTDPQKAERLGQAAYGRMRDHFDDALFNRQRLGVYREIIKRKTGADE